MCCRHGTVAVAGDQRGNLLWWEHDQQKDIRAQLPVLTTKLQSPVVCLAACPDAEAIVVRYTVGSHCIHHGAAVQRRPGPSRVLCFD